MAENTVVRYLVCGFEDYREISIWSLKQCEAIKWLRRITSQIFFFFFKVHPYCCVKRKFWGIRKEMMRPFRKWLKEEGGGIWDCDKAARSYEKWDVFCRKKTVKLIEWMWELTRFVAFGTLVVMPPNENEKTDGGPGLWEK